MNVIAVINPLVVIYLKEDYKKLDKTYQFDTDEGKTESASFKFDKGWAGQGLVQIWNGPGQFRLKRDRIIENLWQGGVLYPEFHRPAVWKQEGEIQGMGSQYIILIDEGYVMFVSCLNRCV